MTNPLRTFLVHSFLLLFALAPGAMAAAPATATCTIAFGESLEGLISGIEEGTNWSISNANGGTVATGKGPSLCAHIFDRPGDYVVRIQEPPHADADECHHGRLPAQVEVHVAEVRMRFVLEDITFTEQIGASYTEGMRMRVPVEIALYKEATVEFEVPEARSAGVGSTLMAHPVSPKVTLTSGTQVLEFTLSGSAERGSYVMFDLVDINGRVVAYPWPTPIN
ncbi:MAG: hypothetical protein KA230_10960 [Flavobacteriales bacterium]|nr:hypothetical protein [Flavobacteriales bacterium]